MRLRFIEAWVEKNINVITEESLKLLQTPTVFSQIASTNPLVEVIQVLMLKKQQGSLYLQTKGKMCKPRFFRDTQI